MDLFRTLQKENAAIRRILDRLEESSSLPPRERRDMIRQVRARLHSCQRAEENHLFPLLMEFPQTHDGVLRSRRENRSTAALLEEMERIDLNDRRFRHYVERLHGELDQHMDWEERELFPQARQVIPAEQIDRLAEQVARELAGAREEQRRF